MVSASPKPSPVQRRIRASGVARPEACNSSSRRRGPAWWRLDQPARWAGCGFLPSSSSQRRLRPGQGDLDGLGEAELPAAVAPLDDREAGPERQVERGGCGDPAETLDRDRLQVYAAYRRVAGLLGALQCLEDERGGLLGKQRGAQPISDFGDEVRVRRGPGLGRDSHG